MTHRAPIPLPQDPSVDTLTLALNYTCNSRCRFCFIEQELDLKLQDTPQDYLDHLFAEHVRQGRPFKRIIFSGAECTLRPDLPDIAHQALKAGGFEVVQIQTNARKLADERYLWKLLAAGISEFFVSVHAGTPELDAWLTRSPRSFEQMRDGIRNLRAVGTRLISNTAVTKGNHEHLEDVARFLIAEGVQESRFWAFIEFGDIGQAAEHVPHGQAAPFLRSAISLLAQADIEVAVSWFPHCLLGEHAHRIDNHRAKLLIHDAFSARAAQNSQFSCPHSQACARFDTGCFGLHSRYVSVFGDQADPLRPFDAA